MSPLVIENLQCRNGATVNLTVTEAECVCLSGPSGSGKTLMLRAIADLDPHGGRVFFGEVESSTISAPEWRKRVTLLPSESHWWYDTVGAHFPSPDVAALRALGFGADVLGWQVHRLSTGERQRLAIVRLLSRRPMALLLDEPTANLDVENTMRVEQLVKAYRKEHRAPVLWVSHDPKQVARVATRWFRIDNGRLIEERV